MERRKLQAEVDVLRLKDQNNAGTLQDLEGMFRGGEGNQELREIHRQLCSLNERFAEQTYDLQRQVAEAQARITHRYMENAEGSMEESVITPTPRS